MKWVATDVGYLSREMAKFQTFSGRLYVCCFEFNKYLAYGLMYGYFYGLIEVLTGGWMISCMEQLIF